MNKPTSLSEAIEQLEAEGGSKVNEIEGLLAKDLQEIKQALADLKPYLAGLKSGLDGDAQKVQQKIESSVRERPWATMGIAGLTGFVLGILFGSGRK